MFGDVDRVEQTGDLVQWSLVGGWALPESGAVEMITAPRREPKRSGRGDLPRPGSSPYLTLRQLEQQGAQGFGDLLQALESQEAEGITNRATDEVMEPFEGASLVHFYVTRGVQNTIVRRLRRSA